MLEENNFGKSIRQLYGQYVDDIPELAGPEIDPDISLNQWLCFSDCMNNGGTSSLYLDFNPLAGGSRGQVIRYLHDPDEYRVIARNFDEYLQLLIDHNYAFNHDIEE
jgi:cell wall assembly regulator SMI1